MPIAIDRANYYAKVDGVQKDSPEWQNEVNWVYKDDFEGIDWLLNNFNWDEWEMEAEKINDNVLVTDYDVWLILIIHLLLNLLDLRLVTLLNTKQRQ
jgi:hypothetical protein